MSTNQPRSPSMSHNEANPVRAAFVKEFAVVGAEVTYLHPLGKVTGKVTRTTEASVWAALDLPTGKTVTFRFTQRQNGEYIMHGNGKYGAVLYFVGSNEVVWARAAEARKARETRACA
ncbi:hypothetical protein SEA_MUFASA8_36 [Arthrobacter phage Mufasa8]|uniref:Uncharacterized protein n=1 Tax=Arthrobacter phage Mufasa8 TaxID=2656526 RepID=A0A649VN32_9CAUD|nr:hypothetical protein HYQ08_gp036 [Arthrobacter phage Mufasa8]QGJ93485.1 hypothetical protein SEA_MUFASA8_36 [Arthrobacter phage Mufasa8]